MLRPRQGRRRNRRTRPKTNDREGSKPHPPTSRKQQYSPHCPTSAHLPARGSGGSRRDSYTTAKPCSHPTEAGKCPPSQATPRATPTGPIDRKPSDHPAQPDDAKPEETDLHGHAATDRPEEKTPRTRRYRPPPEKRQVTNHQDADTAKAASSTQSRKEKKGGEWGPRGTQPEQAAASTRGPQHETTESHTHRTPPPRHRGEVPNRKAGNQHPEHPQKKGGVETPPTAIPTQPPTADSSAPREGQAQTTTKVKKGSPRRTGQAAGTGEGAPAPHKTAAHPSRGNANQQAGVRKNPTRTTRRTTRAGEAGYEGSPYPHAPTKMGEVTSQPLPGHKSHTPAEKGVKRAIPLPSNPPPNPQPAPKHARSKPQPKQAQNRRNPHQSAQTASPGQDQKGAGRYQGWHKTAYIYA